MISVYSVQPLGTMDPSRSVGGTSITLISTVVLVSVFTVLGVWPMRLRLDVRATRQPL